MDSKRNWFLPKSMDKIKIKSCGHSEEDLGSEVNRTGTE